MKPGDKILFSGWRTTGEDGIDQVENVLATLIDIDPLSQSGSGPDRYTIRFDDDGGEQDTVRQCLAACRLGATPEADLHRSQPGEGANNAKTT